MKKILSFSSMTELYKFREALVEQRKEWNQEIERKDSPVSRIDYLMRKVIAANTAIQKIDMLSENALNNEIAEYLQDGSNMIVTPDLYDASTFQAITTLTQRQLGIGEYPQGSPGIQKEIPFDEDVPRVMSLEELLNPRIIEDKKELIQILQEVISKNHFREVAAPVYKFLRAQPPYQKAPIEKIFTDILLGELKCDGKVANDFWIWFGTNILNAIKVEKNPLKPLAKIHEILPELTDSECCELLWGLLKEASGKSDKETVDKLIKQIKDELFKESSIDKLLEDAETKLLCEQFYNNDTSRLRALYQMVGGQYKKQEETPKKEVDTTERAVHNPDRATIPYEEKSSNYKKNKNKFKKR